MQPEYLALLSASVRQFVREVENGAGLNIDVTQDSQLNGGGPTGEGNLEIVFYARRIQLFAPTNGYFPDGAVRHEMLHVHRFHIEIVPKLVPTLAEKWDRQLARKFTDIDNALEHMVIVPVELQFHPERREHWEAVMTRVWSDFRNVPEDDQPLAACLHWSFLRHVLPGSPQIEFARRSMHERALLEMADEFAERLLSVTASKKQMVDTLFLSFPELPRHRAALEYIARTASVR